MPNEKRDEILSAAEKLFTSQPYNKVSIRSIAKSASVSPALILYYFNNKEQLFDQLIEEHASRFQDQFFKYQRVEGIQLQQLISELIEFWESAPNIFLLFTLGGSSFNHENVLRLKESKFGFIYNKTLEHLLYLVDGCNESNFHYYHMLVNSLVSQPYLVNRQQKYNSGSSTFNLMHYQQVIASLFKEENSYAC
ncbi:TetR/AcrR family transcriptional regulator [Vibrio gigantis]|uniref:TetR/AcrR family transcriptional regulator n=1 Tax=Vibrio gigantis TaxID=296199 RepID=A0A5M9NZ96_9VIBR|nr:TetR/AcrR family transcriptional regulator [Vibrio gigantis]KAA8677204.1 TetR/AcrR family transcriptional regulator [Vibrio gigantis]ULN63225.1 TetR/AcrR family transcriptional regulator [Vibrio gigantis]